MDEKKHTSAAQRRASDKWDAANTKKVTIKFMVNGDADILDRLSSRPNKANYIRRLIREDIAREQQQ